MQLKTVVDKNKTNEKDHAKFCRWRWTAHSDNHSNHTKNYGRKGVQKPDAFTGFWSEQCHIYDSLPVMHSFNCNPKIHQADQRNRCHSDMIKYLSASKLIIIIFCSDTTHQGSRKTKGCVNFGWMLTNPQHRFTHKQVWKSDWESHALESFMHHDTRKHGNDRLWITNENMQFYQNPLLHQINLHHIPSNYLKACNSTTYKMCACITNANFRFQVCVFPGSPLLRFTLYQFILQSKHEKSNHCNILWIT